MGRVPIIDVAPFRAGREAGRAAVAAEIARACEDTGFFCIVGHGVELALVDDMRHVCREFLAGRWVSTLHRAVNQPAELGFKDRISIAFFHQPNYHAVIRPFDESARAVPGTEGMTSGEWITLKNQRILE